MYNIIKIIDEQNNYFSIEASDLNNKLDKRQLLEAIESLNNKIKEIDDDCFKIDYEITKLQYNDMGCN
jgi:hypothetical protein